MTYLRKKAINWVDLFGIDPTYGESGESPEQRAQRALDGMSRDERHEWIEALPYSCIPEESDLFIFLTFLMQKGWGPADV